jgi:uncharacterized protein YrzB (UPF0473 family)
MNGGAKMNDEYGNDFISISDEEGNEYELEHLDTIEMDGELYMAFLPADIDEDDERFGVVILKVVEEDGEQQFSNIEDEDELDGVYETFMERLFADEDPLPHT